MRTKLINLIYEVIFTSYKKALRMFKCKEIYFSKEDDCFLFNKNVFHSTTHLKSNQEEADSKVILHCLDALKGPEATVVLRSPSGDTDIMVLTVLLISLSQDRVFIDYGNRKICKAIKLSNVNMATDLKQALVGFHAFTRRRLRFSVFYKRKNSKLEENGKGRKLHSRISGVWYVLRNYARNI